jgi:ribosomal protein S18 acetylase RimI-like enzyme
MDKALEARPSTSHDPNEQSNVPDAIIRRSAEGYVEAWRQFSRMVEHGAIDESDGVTRVATGIRAAHFNPMFVTREPRDLAGAIERARSFYGRAGLPWEVVLVGRRTTTTSFMRVAEAAGLTHASVNPGMVLAPLAGTAREIPGLTVSVVDNPSELLVYNDLIAEGFELGRELLAPLDNPSSLDAQDVVRYLGYADGQPVVTALRATANRVAVIFNVVTLPAYRRRGFGDALTRRAALDGAAEGCVASVLQSTLMGYPVYLKMGYRYVVDFQMWQHEEISSAASK